MRVWALRNSPLLVTWMLGLAGLANRGPAAVTTAQATLSPEPSTTTIIFAHRRLEDCQWTALFDALHANPADAEAESHAISSAPDMVRGDRIQPGMRADTAVVVSLHGDCSLHPLPRKMTYNVHLGWVRLVDGRLEPFAQIDSTRVGQAPGPLAQDLGPDARDEMMTGAKAGVILHEWIDFLSQNPTGADQGLSDQGLSRAHFGVMDFLTGQGHPIARLHRLW